MLVNPLAESFFVVEGGYEYIKMLFDLGYSGCKSIDDADVVMFTGGEDVSPEYYNEQALQGCIHNLWRDRKEKTIFEECVEKKKPMVGICRGGQFLNVMNGGKMLQHVNNHAGNHLMIEHFDKPAKGAKKPEPRTFDVTSTHHQMMRPSADGVVLAYGITESGKPLATCRATYGEEIEGNKGKGLMDVEVVWYPDTSSLCFQPHPEHRTAPKECLDYFNELLQSHILPFIA